MVIGAYFMLPTTVIVFVAEHTLTVLSHASNMKFPTGRYAMLFVTDVEPMALVAMTVEGVHDAPEPMQS